MKIGVLAVQGAFLEHERVLCNLGCRITELRNRSDINSLDGLVLPGGESTVQGKLLHELDMFDPIREMIENDIPVLATCAGLILLAEHISNDDNIYFGTLPVIVKRNAYGRQAGSFRKTAVFSGAGNYDMTFIRAPYIERAADNVSVLARVDDRIVAARYRKQIGLASTLNWEETTEFTRYFWT